MSRPARASFHFGRKLFFVVLLSTIGGFGWAMWETKTPLRDVIDAIGKLFQPLPPVDSPSPDPSPVESPTRSPRPTKTKTPMPTPVPTPSKLSPALSSLYEDIDKELRAGRISAALEDHSKFDLGLLREEERPSFNSTGQRLALLAALFAESATGGKVADPPELVKIFITGGGAGGILAKNLVEAPSDYRFETLDGVRSKVPKANALLDRVARPVVEATLDGELERRAGVANLKVDWDMTPRGRVMRLEPYAGSRVDAIQVFELAEFCARNGAGKRIVPLLEEALRLDGNVAQAVHQGRADALADTLIYHLSVRDRDNAKRGYTTLKERYGDTPAYRDRLEGDAELKKLLQEVLAGEVVAVAPPTPKPTGSPKPTPSPVPTSEPSPTVSSSPAPSPTPVIEPEPEIETSPVESGGSGPTQLPDDAPPKAVDLCAKGDEYYEKAREHLAKANPSVNPKGYQEENRKALAQLDEAFKAYAAAQDLFGSQVPSSLMKRFRDTQMTRSFCRKRSVRH